MRPHTVLHVITHLEPEGAQTLLLDVIEREDPSRYRASVAFLWRGGSAIQDHPALRERCFDLSHSGRFDPLSAYRLARLIRRLDAEIVHTHLVHAGIVGRAAARMARARRLVSTRHYAYDGKQGTLLYRLEDRATAWSDLVIAVSEAVKRDLVARGIARPERVRVIRNGIDAERFDPSRFPGRHQGAVVGSIGRLHPQKGFDVLIEAFAMLNRERPDARLEIVGDGPLRRRLDGIAAAHGIAGAVAFLGAIPHAEIPARLASWDLFVLPSRWEASGIAIMEAMAMERAVVASRVEGIPETLQDGVAGRLVLPEEPAALAAAMRDLLDQPRMRAEMGRNGRARILAEFSIGRVARELDAAYDGLFDSEPGAGLRLR